MYQGEAVNQYRDIITIIVFGPLLGTVLVLIYNLQAVVMDITLINKRDILRTSVIPGQNLDIVLLYLACLLNYMLIRISQYILEEEIPLLI